MENILNLSDSEKRELISATANKMGLNNAIVEKDFSTLINFLKVLQGEIHHL